MAVPAAPSIVVIIASADHWTSSIALTVVVDIAEGRTPARPFFLKNPAWSYSREMARLILQQ